MDDNSSYRPSVLVLTSTFPRWLDDPEPAFVFELSRRLASAFDITVLAPRTPGSLARERMAGMRIIRFPYFIQRWEKLAMHGGGILNKLRTNPLTYLLVPFFFAGQLLALLRLLRSNNFEVIHAHWLIPQGLTASFALYLTGRRVPLLCTSHGSDLFALRGIVLQHLKRRIINRTQALTVVSHAMRKRVVEMGVDPEKVKVISMGVDFKHKYTPELTFNRSINELLFVGRLIDVKGLPILLKALPEVLNKHPAAKLTIAGSGPLEAELRKLTEELDLLKKVRFLGMIPQSQLPSLYRQAALAVFPFVVTTSGHQEGFGLVVLEAMGCECPVIAGDVPAIHDTITHEKTGILVPPGDPQALAQAIIRMLDEPDLRLDLATESRRQVLQKFDWEIIIAKYSNIYSNLIT